MLGIGFFEIVIIALVAFIVLGPKQLPMVMKKLAIYYRQFLNLKDELNFQILSVDVDQALIDEKSTPKSEKPNDTVMRENEDG